MWVEGVRNAMSDVNLHVGDLMNQDKWKLEIGKRYKERYKTGLQKNL